MALEDRELRSFLVLAEQLHFGRAANLLHISQPGLSKQIKGLEEKIGGALTLEKIAHEPFIVIGREVSTTYYDHCIRLCGSAGFSPRVVQEARDTFTLLNLVRAGIGVALVPRSARQMRVSGVRFSDINRREAEWDVGVAWHKLHESALVRNFVEICLAVA